MAKIAWWGAVGGLPSFILILVAGMGTRAETLPVNM
jgi:hypothetical protein